MRFELFPCERLIKAKQPWAVMGGFNRFAFSSVTETSHFRL